MFNGRLIVHKGIASYARQDNVDTDMVIPKQFLVTTTSGGLGRHAFQQWREPTPNGSSFFLAHQSFAKPTILVVRRNFGCGSSREHAPWSLKQFGFRVLVGISFAEIFYLNCLRNGLLPVTLKEHQVNKIHQSFRRTTRTFVTINLLAKRVLLHSYSGWTFHLASLHKVPLVKGSADTRLAPKHAQEALKYERLLKTPFLPN